MKIGYTPGTHLYEVVQDIGTQQFIKNLYKGLIDAYSKDPSVVADLCDEFLDKRGVLLGEVRDLHNDKQRSSRAR